MSHRLSSQVVLLTYHDFVPHRDRNALWFDCTAQEFEFQLNWLISRGAKFINLDQLRAHLVRGAPLPRGAVALTFADGYEGFYQRAWPILRAHKIPAAMFVHTGFVGDRHGRPKMTWAQLAELQASGLITIGSETVTHPLDLRNLQDQQIEREMTASKADLERHRIRPVYYLAYPNGKFDARSEAAARKAGYLMAFSEKLTPAERSPGILSVSRWVHTKYRQAWRSVKR